MQVAELSVRVNPVGPPLAPSVTLSAPGLNPNGRATIVILIHGYNTCHDEAKLAYDAFLASLQAAASLPIALPVYEFFWPGDEAMSLFSGLSYPKQIKTVRDAALLLNSWLWTLHGPAGGPIDIHFIAHSLGNRLLINLLNSISFPPLIQVRSATLMAAAVPVSLAGYGSPLYPGCLVPAFTQVLHSRSDSVLHWAFPLGETAFGEAFLPAAIGRNGDPAANWRASYPFDTFLHGDYWKRPGPPNLVAGCLGLGTPRLTRSNRIAARQTASRMAS